ncbi:hypothetical protein GCM10017562_65130 [Streptomyces roseofulvus]|uniref:phosphotransferase n=1 Tax=Streptomyces roseofulvus TaxID=33902 RepID=UPI0031FBC287
MGNRLHEISAVSDEDVASVAERYGLGGVASWSLCGQGLINTNLRVVSVTGFEWLLRIYAPDRLESEVRFELSVLEQLERADFPAPRPLRDLEGEPLGRLGGRCFSVLTFLPGATVGQEGLTTSLARQVGSLYGAFRAAVADFTPDGARESGDHEAVLPLLRTTLAAVAEAEPGVADHVRTAWESVEAAFRPDRDRATGVVHGDLFYENILVRGGELVAFIDFDDAYCGLILLDLALVVMEFATPPDEILDGTLAAAVLDGYAQAVGELEYTGAELYDALLFLCCKFFCYTLELTLGEGEPATANPYYRRLVDLTAPGRRAALQEVLSARAIR